MHSNLNTYIRTYIHLQISQVKKSPYFFPPHTYMHILLLYVGTLIIMYNPYIHTYIHTVLTYIFSAMQASPRAAREAGGASLGAERAVRGAVRGRGADPAAFPREGARGEAAHHARARCPADAAAHG